MTITLKRSLVAAAAMASTLLLLVCTGMSAEDTKPAPKPFKEEELAALLAPIALYPDQVVAQILMASTYPLEVVVASRWVKANASLKGEALATAAKKQSWDQSVQALTARPDVLKMMDETLDWTQKLGDAFLAQQTEVMAMVQTLRKKAKDAGNLKSDEHQTVKVEKAPAASATAPSTATAPATATAPSTQTIVIQPTNPEVIYVPTYSPTYVYGPWAYPAYPPYYYYPPAYYPAAGFWWGVGVGISIGIWGGAWNNHCDWHGGSININTGGNINVGGGGRNDIGGANPKWKHNPEHRKGVSYRDNATAKKYDRGSSPRASTNDAFRGRSGTGPSAGTRDLSGGAGASAGTRDLGGGTGASAGTRDMPRGTTSGSTRPSTTSPSTYGGSRGTSGGSSYKSGGSDAFGGMSSGARASSYGSRGGMSRGGGGGGRRR